MSCVGYMGYIGGGAYVSGGVGADPSCMNRVILPTRRRACSLSLSKGRGLGRGVRPFESKLCADRQRSRSTTASFPRPSPPEEEREIRRPEPCLEAGRVQPGNS
jgi:hypothetical protein